MGLIRESPSTRDEPMQILRQLLHGNDYSAWHIMDLGPKQLEKANLVGPNHRAREFSRLATIWRDVIRLSSHQWPLSATFRTPVYKR